MRNLDHNVLKAFQIDWALILIKFRPDETYRIHYTVIYVFINFLFSRLIRVILSTRILLFNCIIYFFKVNSSFITKINYILHLLSILLIIAVIITILIFNKRICIIKLEIVKVLLRLKIRYLKVVNIFLWALLLILLLAMTF
jgi:hypothetical protein